MKKVSKYVAMMALGMAASAALPNTQLFAQDRDRDRDGRNQRDERDRDRDRGRERNSDRDRDSDRGGQRPGDEGVTADELPREVRQTIEQEARGIDHFIDRQTRDGRTEYVVHYTRPGNQRMVLRVDERGELVGEPKLARIQHGRETTDRDVREEAADKGVKVRTVSERDLPDAVRRTARRFTQDGKDLLYREQIRDGKTFYAARFTTEEGERMWVRIAENGEVAEGPEINIGRDIGLNVATARNDRDRGRDRDRDRDRMRDRDRDRDDRETVARRDGQMRTEQLNSSDLPADVLRTVEQETAGGTEHRIIRETSRDGEVSYFVQYQRDGRQAHVRVDERGRVLAKGDGAADLTPSPTEQARQEELNSSQLPAEVRQTIQQEAPGATEHRFIRETNAAGQVSYFVEYTLNGQRANLRVDERGKVLAKQQLADATPQPQQPLQPAASGDDAELEGAGSVSAHQILLPNELPAEVSAAITQNTPGATQHLFQRHTQDGQVLYSVHYATPEGDYNFMAVDERGQVLVQPRASKWLEGRRGVKFEVLNADQVPAEVRQTIQDQAPKATEHVFVRRVRPDAEPTYLVQFTNARGRRMQMEVNANGKLRNEPSAAVENPFRMAERREGRQERREERREERRSERQ